MNDTKGKLKNRIDYSGLHDQIEALLIMVWLEQWCMTILYQEKLTKTGLNFEDSARV